MNTTTIRKPIYNFLSLAMSTILVAIFIPLNAMMTLPQEIVRYTPTTTIPRQVMELTTEKWILDGAINMPKLRIHEYTKEGLQENYQPWKRYTRSIAPNELQMSGQRLVKIELKGHHDLQRLKQLSLQSLYASLHKINLKKKKKCDGAYIKKQLEGKKKKTCLNTPPLKKLINAKEHHDCVNNNIIEKQVTLMAHAALNGLEQLSEIKRHPINQYNIYNPKVTVNKIDDTYNLAINFDPIIIVQVLQDEPESYFTSCTRSIKNFVYTLLCKKIKED